MHPRAQTAWNLAWRYGFAIASVVLATWVTKRLEPYLGESISLLFFAAVVLSTWFGGVGPGLVATALAGWASAYFFVNPPGSFWFSWDDAIRLSLFLMVALLISFLITLRKRAEAALRRSHDELEQRVHQRTAELRTSNDRLRESEEKFRLLVEGVGDYAIIMLDAQGAVASWNSGAQRVYGHHHDEIVGTHVARLFPPDFARARVDQILHEAATLQRREDEGWRARKDGSWFWANVITTAVNNDRGQLRGFAQITRNVTELRSLERQVLEISEQERRRVGHDLHDGLGQELTAMAFLSQNLARKLESLSVPAAPEATRLVTLANHAIEQTRELARGFAPVELGPDGLHAALRELALKTQDIFQIPCRFESRAPVQIRDDVAAGHLYRIAQEAINNAVRHAKATHLRITLDATAHDMILTVEDDGIGLPPAKARGKGMGLSLMLYRARMIGASLEVRPAAGGDSGGSGGSGGTAVSCVYPNPDMFTLAKSDERPTDSPGAPGVTGITGGTNAAGSTGGQVDDPGRGRSPDRARGA